MIELEIEGYAPPGNGLAKYQGKKVFIPSTAIGDRVRVEVVVEKKNHLLARLVEVVEGAPNRIEPPCPHYNDCGGCTMMHLPYIDQLEIKRKIFVEEMEAKELEYSLSIEPSTEIFAYRYKSNLKAGNGAVGFCRNRSESVISIPDCKILSHGILKSLGPIANIKDNKADYPILESQAKGAVAAVRTIGKRQSSMPGFPHAIIENYGFGEMELQAGNFAQANPFVTRQIAEEIVANCNSSDIVVEFYSGSGTFSIPIAQNCKQLFSYEIDKRAWGVAKRNLEKLDLTNVVPKCGNVIQSEIPIESSLIVVDPPRAGLERNLINKIINSSARRILYVSCNPNSLTKDLKELTTKGGYTITSLTAFDMYCHTTHLESLALLDR